MDKIEEIRSDEVQEILNRAPNWMIRWGITLFFCLIILLLFISWFIKYPDVVEGQVTLTTSTPPALLVSQTNGYVLNLYHQNGEILKRGDYIASIQNPTKKSSLDSLIYIMEGDLSKESVEELKNINDLGGIQPDVNSLIFNLTELENLIDNKFFKQSLRSLSEQIEFNNRLAWITKQELELLQDEFSNATEKYKADSSLYANKVIAKVTFFNNQSEYFAKKQQIINTKRTYVQNKITSANLKAQKNELLKNNEDQIRQITSDIENSKKNIQTYLDNWQQNYIFKAPQPGKLTYLTNLAVNDFVTTNQELFAVVPNDKEIISIVKIANQAFGKVQKGQKVRMKFANFPYQEFGQLLGEVYEVSNIPTKEGYFLKVKLSNGLTTSYQQEISYQPEMMGVAEVVTDDLRLIERVFNNFRKVFDQ